MSAKGPRSRPGLVNLLDDFTLGGVSKGLSIFDADPIQAVVDTSVAALKPDALFAPIYDADVIVLHVPANWQRLLLISSLKWRNRKAKLIWVEHSYTRAWEALKVPAPARFRKMLGLAYRLADAIVCVSHAQAHWLSEVSGIPLEAIDVIHPYSTNPGLAAVPAPAFTPGARLRIGAYGRLSEQKGFDDLIRAHRAGWMPGTELVIGGTGADEAMLRELAGDSQDIHFAGLITDVAAFLSGCDVVAVPSRWEAYGQVANEAREAARPILVAPVDGLPEQARFEAGRADGLGHAGLVIDFTTRAGVADGMERLRKADLPAMARAARASAEGGGAERQMQWAKLIDRLLTDGGQSADVAMVA